MERMKYPVIIEKSEASTYIAKVPDLPGCSIEGRTRKELMKKTRCNSGIFGIIKEKGRRLCRLRLCRSAFRSILIFKPQKDN